MREVVAFVTGVALAPFYVVALLVCGAVDIACDLLSFPYELGKAVLDAKGE